MDSAYRKRRLAEFFSYALVILSGYMLVWGFEYIQPIGGVKLPRTDFTLSELYVAGAVVAAYFGRRFRLDAAWMLEGMIGVIGELYAARIAKTAAVTWPEEIGADYTDEQQR